MISSLFTENTDSFRKVLMVSLSLDYILFRTVIFCTCASVLQMKRKRFTDL